MKGAGQPLSGYPGGGQGTAGEGRLEASGDLVVDPAGLFREYPEDWQTLRRSEWLQQASAPEDLPGFSRLESCIECGACLSACPVEDFLGPALLAGLNRELANRPQREKELLEMANSERALRRYRRALECSRVCPTGVYPARHIEELRRRLNKGR